MRCRTILPLLFTIGCLAAPASAQQLSLTIRDGLVNLDASGASVRQILDAWSRVGGTRIVNAERVSSAPVTMKLENVPERKALEIILRSVAGYMAAPRAASAAPGASLYDRIMVLPTSSAPQTAAKGGTAPPTPQNPFFRGRPDLPEDTADDAVSADADANQPPVFSFPNHQGQAEPAVADQQNPFAPNTMNQAQGAPFGQPAQPAPFGQPAAAPFGQPAQTPFGQPAQTPFGQPSTTPFGQPQQPTAAPFGQPQPAQPSPFGQPQAPTNPFGQISPTTPFGQVQAPVMNPFAAAAAQAQQQQQQQQQNTPAPGSFTIIGSPTPGVIAQPQPTQPGQRPPGKQ